MREIVLDTETTGISPDNGDRVVEIGCVEVLNRIPSGREFHVYINPERDMPKEAEQVHGLSGAFLADKPVFAKIAADFVAFIGGDPIVAHNASFDVGFLNMELSRLSLARIGSERVIDTLALARRKHPAGPNSLDALCKRYGVDNSGRDKHGALIDADLLASVYLELVGGRQAALELDTGPAGSALRRRGPSGPAQQRPSPLPSCLDSAADAAHRAFVKTLGAQAVWFGYGAFAPPHEAAEPIKGTG
jgi:DNA polymerase III subunit epsilon